MVANTWGIIFIIGYLVLLVAISIYATRLTKNMSDFALGGKKIRPELLAICMAATAHSVGTFVGNGGMGYAFGFSTLWHALMMPIPFILSVIVFAKLAHRMAQVEGSISLPDWLGHRYQSDAVRIAVALVVLLMVVTVLAQFSGAATTFQTILGIPYVWGLILAVGIVTAYSLFGGTYADVYTDVLQAVIMGIGAIAMFISVFWVFKDGLVEVSSTLEAIDPELIAVFNPQNPLYSSFWVVLVGAITQIWYAAEPQHFNKVLSVGNEKQLRNFIITLTIALMILSLPDFGGIFMRALEPSVQMPADFRPDMANLLYIQYAFPPVLAALFMVAILGAVMSTMDGLLVSLATAVSNDIYRRVLVPRGLGGIRPDASVEEIDRRTLLVSRIVVLALGVIALLFIAVPPDFVAIMMLAGRGALAAAAAGPVFLGMFWKRANAPGALASIIVGSISYVLIYFVFHLEVNPLMAQFYGIIAGIVAMVIVSLLTKPVAEEELNKFFPQSKKAYAKEI